MRLWSISPAYLDTKGLLAVWREGLLAKKVLEGKTRGYTKHPQLLRFRACAEPILAINSFLYYILAEARVRGYHFDETKINAGQPLCCYIPVTEKQVAFEFSRLLGKLETRDPARCSELTLIAANTPPKLNGLFFSVPGRVESWEKAPSF